MFYKVEFEEDTTFIKMRGMPRLDGPYVAKKTTEKKLSNTTNIQ